MIMIMIMIMIMNMIMIIMNKVSCSRTTFCDSMVPEFLWQADAPLNFVNIVHFDMQKMYCNKY